MTRSHFFNKVKSFAARRKLKFGIRRTVNNVTTIHQWPSGTTDEWEDELIRLQARWPRIKRNRAIRKRQRALKKQLLKQIRERQLKTFNIHIVAIYNFPKRERKEEVNISFATRAVDKVEVESRIDSLRSDWEEEQNAIINGATDWEFEAYVSVNIVLVEGEMLANTPMFSAKWSYKLLGDMKTININPGECVTDYLLYEFSRPENKRRFSDMTKEKIIKLIGNKSGYTTNDIIDFAKKSDYISVRALSPMGGIFMSYKAKIHTKVNLCFIVNNNHCYPILDKSFKQQITARKSLDLSTFEWTVKYREHKYYNTAEEFLSEDKGDNKIVLINVNDLTELARKIVKDTEIIIQGMKYSGSVLVSFEHPGFGTSKSSFIIESAYEYTDRRLALQSIQEEYNRNLENPDSLESSINPKKLPIESYYFKNQSWATISANYYSNNINSLNLLNSIPSEELHQELIDYPIKPYIRKYITDKQIEKYNKIYDGVTADICKSYTNVILKNKDPYPRFTPFDEKKDINLIITDTINWVPGEYYINKRFNVGEFIEKPAGMYPLNLTKYCYEKGYITIDDISQYRQSTMYYPADHLAKHVNAILDLPIDDTADSTHIEQSIKKPLDPMEIDDLDLREVIIQEIAEKALKSDSAKQNLESAPGEMDEDLAELIDNEQLFEKRNKTIKKHLVNHFIGILGRHHKTSQKGCITDSLEMAVGTFYEEERKHNDCFIHKVEDFYVIRSTKKTKLLETSVPIYRHIIAGGIINLAEAFDKLTTFPTANSDSELLSEEKPCIIASCKVDSISLYNHNTEHIVDDADKQIGDLTYEKFTTSGKIKNIDSVPKFQPTIKRDWIKKIYKHTDKDFEELFNSKQSVWATGMSGSAKSTNIKKYISSLSTEKQKKVKCLAHSNKAVIVLRRKGIKDVDTIDHMFFDHNGGLQSIERGLEKMKNYDEIIFDEASTLPWKLIYIASLLKKEGKRIMLFGDVEQCLPVEEFPKPPPGFQLYDYEKSQLVKELCDYRHYTVEYVPEFGRYDNDAFKAVINVMKIGQLHNNCKAKKLLKSCFTNMAYTNKKCDEVNTAELENYKKKYPKRRRVDGINNSGIKDDDDTEYIEGMPLLCIRTDKKRGVYKSEKYYVDKITNSTETGVGIGGLDLMSVYKMENGEKVYNNNYFMPYPLKKKDQIFKAGFCITVHKYQGDEINEPYNIYESESMTKRIFYTALGRCRKLSQVNFDANKLSESLSHKYGKRFRVERVNKKSILQDNHIKSTKKRKESKLKFGDPNFKPYKPTVKIVQKIQLVKLNTVDKYKIIDDKKNNLYYIKYRISHPKYKDSDSAKLRSRTIQKKGGQVRYGKRTTKEDALNKIRKIQCTLRNFDIKI